jgi:hypothetical protein
MTLPRIHEVGAARHPVTWFMANHAAVAAMWDYPGPIDEEIKRLVSLVVLRVLDRVQPDEAGPSSTSG